jgi:hypothetical protein
MHLINDVIIGISEGLHPRARTGGLP